MEVRGKKLALACRLIAEGSKYLHRTCAECQTFQWSDEGLEGINFSAGTRKKYRSVQACLDAGAKPTRRVPLTLTPCYECPKVPDNAPVKSVYFATEISDLTWQVIAHFEECDAVNQFPEDDPIVRKNAATIRRIREQAKHAEHGKGMAYIFSLLTMGAAGR